MAAPPDESIFQLLTPKEAVCARLLVRYIARKRHIAADSAAELQAARLATKDEQRLAEDAIIQRPRPHSVGDMLLLMGAIVANQPTLARRAFYVWLLYCVVLPLYILGRWEVYLERLWWNCVLLWRIWKLAWKREVQIWWLVCELREEAKQELSLGKAEAKELMGSIRMAGDAYVWVNSW